MARSEVHFLQASGLAQQVFRRGEVARLRGLFGGLDDSARFAYCPHM